MPISRRPAVAEFAGLSQGGELTAVEGTVSDGTLQPLEPVDSGRHLNAQGVEVRQQLPDTETPGLVAHALSTQDALVLVVLLDDVALVPDRQHGPGLAGVKHRDVRVLSSRRSLLTEDGGDRLRMETRITRDLSN